LVYTVINQNSDKPDSREKENTPKSGVGFWNLDLELQAIKTVLTPSSEWAAKVYSVCKPDFFHHSTTKAIFTRLHSMMESSKNFELPTLDFVLSDSKISPAIRDTLRDSFAEDEVAIVASQGDFDLLVQGLTSLAKTRALYQATHKAANELLDSAEPTDLIKQVSDKLGESLFRMEDDDELLAQITMGRGYNQSAEDSFSRIVNGIFDELKIKTGFKEFDERTGGFHRTNLVILGGSSGGGKCTIFNTRIPTNHGVMQIGDIYNLYANPDDKGWISVPKGELQVYTREGIREVDGVYKTEGSTYRIETKWGDEFEGLGEHKLYCYDSEKRELGFKRLCEIQVERDWVLKTVGNQLFGNKIDIPYAPIKLTKKHNKRFEDIEKYPTQLTSDLAIVFGLIVSEGYRAKSICNNDISLLIFTQNVFQSHFGCSRQIKPNRLPRHYICFGRYLEQYFTSFTGDLKSGSRIIPKCIMQAHENIQCAFLRGLYEGDGSIHEMGNTERGKNSWALQYTSISKQLIYEIKSLLENIGIYCVVYFHKKTSIYYLHVIKESYVLFQQKIGFLSDAKNSELTRCIDHKIKMNACSSSEDTNHLCSGHYNQIPKQPIIDYIHRVFVLMKDQTIQVIRNNMKTYERPIGRYHALFTCHGPIQKILGSKTKFTSTYTANLIITSHHRWSSVYENKPIPVLPHIRDLIENDTILKDLRSHIKELCSHVWAQVSSLEKKDDVVPVFDLSVPGPQEYAANGLMSHNSLFAVNLLERQYRLGYNVILASYEMDSDEVLIRLLSNVGEVDMSRLQNNKLTPPETNQVTAAWREFNLKGYEKGNSYHIICPKTETTVPEIGFRVRSLKPDVLILDYINLLGSSSGTAEAQWQVLGDISREAKLLANKLNCVVILLAQIDDTYNLRYSKGIKDHANFVAGWVRDETSINSRIINIHQMKARNAPLYNFDLVERFDIAQFRDPGQDDRKTWPTQDELLMLELQCQSVGLKLEPTVSKEFDKKKREEIKQVVNSNKDKERVADEKIDNESVSTASLLFSSENIPVDFSKLTVKSSSVSLLNNDNLLYEDTV